jgi:hypothetical protein
MKSLTTEPFIIERVYLPTETLGSLYFPDMALIAKTMELPWKDNKPNISCIPEGDYIIHKMKPGVAGRDYGYFRFEKVDGRSKNLALNMSTILMHRITYVKDLKGCVGIGSRFKDFNKDGVPDMEESSKKLQWMYDNLPDTFLLTIRKKP